MRASILPASLLVPAFAHDLKTLINAYAPARAATSAVRDRAAPPDTGAIAIESFHDWACPNS